MESLEQIKQIIKEQETKDLLAFLEDCSKHSEGARAGDPSSIAWVKKIIRASIDSGVTIYPIIANVAFDYYLNAETDSPDYLDPKDPRYAPKLAAAVRAWQAVTDEGGKHPKQALAKWIREHAAELGMTDGEGKPNETGIEEVAKVANWKPGGGAPKTPGE